MSKRQSFMVPRDLNSFVHYFRLRVAPIFVSRVNRKTITVRFTELKKLHEYIINGLKSQLNDRMTSFPVNFRFYQMLKISFSKILIALTDSSRNFRGSL